MVPKRSAPFLLLPQIQLPSHDDFISNVVLKSDKVKNAVVNHLAKQIQQNNNPSLINSYNGGSIGAPKLKPAQTLSEAKEIARKFFD